MLPFLPGLPDDVHAVKKQQFYILLQIIWLNLLKIRNDEDDDYDDDDDDDDYRIGLVCWKTMIPASVRETLRTEGGLIAKLKWRQNLCCFKHLKII